MPYVLSDQPLGRAILWMAMRSVRQARRMVQPMMITLAQMAVAAPKAGASGRLDAWYPALCEAMAEFDITTDARQAMFLANLMEETGELAVQRESMDYSPARLQEVFGIRPDLAFQLVAAGWQAIANYVYADANRPEGYKLGNTQEGDGWRFRGSGPMQTTGRSNTEAAFRALGLPIDSDPNMLCQPLTGSRAAAFFWKSAGCNALADAGDFLNVVRAVNGGLTNLSIRENYLTDFEDAMQEMAA